jgi:sugar lactone lactonase YvrE
LALSPNGNTAYAANVALGVVAEISLTDFQVKRVVEFLATGSGQVDNDKPTNYSVVSQDGRSLYFSSGWDVWRYDTQLRQVDGPYAKGTIQGLALSQDEQTLYVALAGHLPQKIDLQSKSALSFKSEPAK